MAEIADIDNWDILYPDKTPSATDIRDALLRVLDEWCIKYSKSSRKRVQPAENESEWVAPICAIGEPRQFLITALYDGTGSHTHYAVTADCYMKAWISCALEYKDLFDAIVSDSFYVHGGPYKDMGFHAERATPQKFLAMIVDTFENDDYWLTIDMGTATVLTPFDQPRLTKAARLNDSEKK